MRALWLTLDYPHPAAPIGGIFHQTQAEALTRLGIGVQVVAPVPYVPPLFEKLSPKWHLYKRTPRAYEINGVQVFRPTYPQLPRADTWGLPHRMIARAVERLNLPRPDLIHAHFAYPSGLVADTLARRWRVPWLLTLHGSDANIYPDASPLA